MIPREFFIEDRLEKNRLTVSCNLGESGLKNFTLKEVMDNLDLSLNELGTISLADSPNQGRLDLRTEVAKLYNNISADEVLITTGTSESLYLLFHLLIEKDDLVSLFTPAFQALYEIPLMLGAKIQEVEVNHHFSIEKLFKNIPKLVILNHPHNPTGVGLTESNRNELKEKMLNFSGNILFDEHYRFLDYSKDLGFSGAGLNDKTFATGSITKCFGVTGLRIGWIIGNPNILQKLRSFKDYLTHTVNPISEFLALEILKQRNKLSKPIKTSVLKNIESLASNVHLLPGINSFRKPDGGLVANLTLTEGIFSEKYADELLKQCDIFVLPASNFEREGFIRVGFGETNERFQAGIERWKKLEI